MVHPSLSTESTCLAGKGVHSGQGDPAGERGMAEYLEDLSNPSSGHLPGSGLLTAPQTRQPHIPAHLLPTSEPTDQRGLRSACTIPLCSDGQAGTALNHEERSRGTKAKAKPAVTGGAHHPWFPSQIPLLLCFDKIPDFKAPECSPALSCFSGLPCPCYPAQIDALRPQPHSHLPQAWAHRQQLSHLPQPPRGWPPEQRDCCLF